MTSPARDLRAPLRHVAGGRRRSLRSPARAPMYPPLQVARPGDESAGWGVGEEEPLDSVEDGGGVHFFFHFGGRGGE